MWQKSRIQWLKEDDANSRFFHSWVNKQRRHNEILCLLVEDREVVQVDEIRQTVREHFQAHFFRQVKYRPDLTQLSFQVIGQQDNEVLVAPFGVEEIREAVWSCDSAKSPGPDDFNYCFIKEFWEVMKDDVIAFIQEFHRHGRCEGPQLDLYCPHPKIGQSSKGGGY